MFSLGLGFMVGPQLATYLINTMSFQSTMLVPILVYCAFYIVFIPYSFYQMRKETNFYDKIGSPKPKPKPFEGMMSPPMSIISPLAQRRKIGSVSEKSDEELLYYEKI